MDGIQIVSTGRQLPEQIITNEDLSKMVDTSDEWIRTRTGISARHISKEERNMDLASQAAKKAMQKGNIKPEEIGIVLIATVTPDYITPAVATMVQKELALSEDTMSFDISAGCSGFLYGIKICKGLLENATKPYALLIGSEQLSRMVDFTDRQTCVLFGDGAGAAILKLSNEHTYYQRVWSDGNDEALVCLGPGNWPAKLKMDGQAVFRFAVKVCKQGIDQILEDSQLTFDQIDYVLCHQANERIIDYVKKKYELPDEKFFMNLQKFGNTSSASIPMAIDEMTELGMIHPGTKIISVAFGAGFTWSSVLLTF